MVISVWAEFKIKRLRSLSSIGQKLTLERSGVPLEYS